MWNLKLELFACLIAASLGLGAFLAAAQDQLPSLRCDDSVCLGTKAACTCSVHAPDNVSVVLIWRLPGNDILNDITFSDSSVGESKDISTFINFTAILTNVTEGKESILKFNATATEYEKINITCVGIQSGSISNSTMVVTIADLPSAPDTVSVQSTTYNSATIQWTTPSDINNGGPSITGYNITISPPPSESCSTGTCIVSNDTLQYTFTGLNHTQKYNISIAAINCAGTGSTTQLQPNLDINATVPNPPGDIEVSLIKNMSTNDQISLSVRWEEPLPSSLSPPVNNYCIIIDGVCYISIDTSEDVAIDIGTGEYTVTVIANNDVGASIESMALNIDLLNCSTSSDSNSITINCSSTFTNETYSVMLGGNTKEGDIAEALTFLDLEPTTTYTYTAMLVGVNGYSVVGNNTTSGASQTLATTAVSLAVIIGGLILSLMIV